MARETGDGEGLTDKEILQSVISEFGLEAVVEGGEDTWHKAPNYMNRNAWQVICDHMWMVDPES